MHRCISCRLRLVLILFLLSAIRLLLTSMYTCAQTTHAHTHTHERKHMNSNWILHIGVIKLIYKYWMDIWLRKRVASIFFSVSLVAGEILGEKRRWHFHFICPFIDLINLNGNYLSFQRVFITIIMHICVPSTSTPFHNAALDIQFFHLLDDKLWIPCLLLLFHL